MAERTCFCLSSDEAFSLICIGHSKPNPCASPGGWSAVRTAPTALRAYAPASARRRPSHARMARCGRRKVRATGLRVAVRTHTRGLGRVACSRWCEWRTELSYIRCLSRRPISCVISCCCLQQCLSPINAPCAPQNKPSMLECGERAHVELLHPRGLQLRSRLTLRRLFGRHLGAHRALPHVAFVQQRLQQQ